MSLQLAASVRIFNILELVQPWWVQGQTKRNLWDQRQDHFLNFERMRDREVSLHTTYTSRSRSRSGSHVSHGEDTKNLQLEVDHLRT